MERKGEGEHKRGEGRETVNGGKEGKRRVRGTGGREGGMKEGKERMAL